MHGNSFLRYLLDVRPVGLLNCLNYYQAIGRAALNDILSVHRATGHFLFGGRSMLVKSDDLIFCVRSKTLDLTMVALCQDPYPVVQYFAPNEGDVVIDIGANIGAYSIRAAKVAKLVVAFEPEPRCFSILQQNIVLNRLRNVCALPYAISDENGKAQLFVRALETGCHSLIVQNGCPSVEVETRMLDTVISKIQLRQIDWLKVDVEGSELGVLRGARETLRKTRRIIVEIGRLADRADILDLLSSQGLKVSKSVQCYVIAERTNGNEGAQ